MHVGSEDNESCTKAGGREAFTTSVPHRERNNRFFTKDILFFYKVSLEKR